jgi:hypothetical protein
MIAISIFSLTVILVLAVALILTIPFINGKNCGNKAKKFISWSPVKFYERLSKGRQNAPAIQTGELLEESKCTGYQPDHDSEILIGIDPPCAVCGAPKREHSDAVGSEMTPERIEMFRSVIQDNHQRANIIKQVDLIVRYLAEFPTELWDELIHVDNQYMARLHKSAGTAFKDLTHEQRTEAIKATMLTIEKHDYIRQLPEIFFDKVKPRLTDALRAGGFDKCQNE